MELRSWFQYYHVSFPKLKKSAKCREISRNINNNLYVISEECFDFLKEQLYDFALF